MKKTLLMKPWLFSDRFEPEEEEEEEEEEEKEEEEEAEEKEKKEEEEEGEEEIKKNILAVWWFSGLVLSQCIFAPHSVLIVMKTLKAEKYIAIKSCKLTVFEILLICYIFVYCVSVLFLHTESTDSTMMQNRYKTRYPNWVDNPSQGNIIP